ncbi:putative proton-dependent oligopeptide transporter family, major facilitator superfamily [Medicago truncatula]|uniref:Peptide/nitrate transporter plant-like protein n=1 Tax=Medicago truncatula TaxID=3880 RepID=G7KJG0_MEDTR|nr:protein NRT1/ PTR FAMILY 5.8 [Medicago truncatula]AES74588.2 peptide/nitrate transporter plant-like protein [Medicago truncatula]RHN49925.1 putative proton-dependent oligopeptide transporter family, major facilitator superfamily [Medicago truncatula]
MAGGQKTKRLSNSCILLIVIAGIERFAFKGVASNLVTYLTDVVDLSNSSAAKMVNSWVGFTSIMPLLVAPIADAYWAKYSTIMSSSFLYVMGLAALTTTALARSWHHKNRSMSSSFLSLSLYLISLGQGGYNPSLQAFGADQLGEDEELPCSNTDDTSSNKKALFFQWWYFGVCAGSLMGVTVMSYIQDTFGWVIGFAIPAISMLLSILIFSSGSSIYSYKEQDDDDLQDKKPFTKMFKSIKESALKCFHCEITLPNDKSENVELELQERPLCHENCESIKVINKDSKVSMCLLPNVKVMIKLLPIWTMLLMFAVIFQQPATFFTKQGMTMKRNIGSNFKIPPATLQSAITLSIILLMPLYNRIFIPFAQLITRQEKGINVMQRMGIGMVLSIIAMIIAALVEMKRLAIGRQMRSEGLLSEIVPISIFWLLPQYILLGISDIFTVVGMQEFFYGEVPKNMRTMGIALYTSVFGVGSFVSALMITLVEVYTSSKGTPSWFSDDMVEARLDNYYWLLAWLSSISLLLYTLLCKYYYNKSESDS